LSVSEIRKPPSANLLPYATLFRSPADAINGRPINVLVAVPGAKKVDCRVDGCDCDCHKKSQLDEEGQGVRVIGPALLEVDGPVQDRKSTRLNSSHVKISYAVFCLK